MGRIRFRENWSRDMWLLLAFVLLALFFLIRWLANAPPAYDTGGTTLRYDGTQFIQNWRTPKTLECFAVIVQAAARLTACQKANRNPTCSRRMALAVRMTPNVVDVAPEGTEAPG